MTISIIVSTAKNNASGTDLWEVESSFMELTYMYVYILNVHIWLWK